jgi:nucleoid DNA-binding protein
MTKEHLAEAVRAKLQGSKKQAQEVVDLLFDKITDALKKGEEVAISGFGSFRVTKRAARSGVNPRTGEKISIPPMNVPKFRAGKGLKDAVK